MSMELTPYVERLRDDLAQAAAAGTAEVREAAQRLAVAMDPSTRLMLMEALSEAAAEITSEMRTGSVDVRLSGRDLEFHVEQFEALASPQHPTPPMRPDADDETDGAAARITLRLPESLKAKAEELASSSGQSLNTWIVTTLRGATREGAFTIALDLSSLPMPDAVDLPAGRHGRRRISGWI